MAWNKNHFTLITDTIKAARTDDDGVRYTDPAVTETLDHLTADFADALKNRNDSFDRARFFDAAGVAPDSGARQ